jgi:hypothetical protein
MTTITEDGGRTNIYAVEPEMYTTEVTVNHNEFAEKLNGRLAMLGVIAALGSYAVTGQIIPGIW